MHFSVRHLSLILIVFSWVKAHSQTGFADGKLIGSNPEVHVTSFTLKMISKSGNIKQAKIDSSGHFTFKNLVAGTYTFTAEAPQYEKFTKINVIVKANDTTHIGEISPISKVLIKKKVVISKTQKQSTEAAGVTDVRKNDAVTNIVTAEQITKTQASDAAKVAASVPGVTLMENRFIMLRGLSQRYNSVQINSINAPSTEVDKRAFSFDLIPSNLLDRLEVFKSPSGELAGDFSGGDIKIQTKGEPEKNYYNYSIGVGFRLNTTFTTRQNNSVGSTTDLFGFDNGNRALPSGFPANLADYSNSKAIVYGKTLRNNYELNDMFVPLDFGAGFGFGKNIKLKKMLLYTVNNFGYSTNYQFSESNRYRYQYDSFPRVRQMFNYTDMNFSVESKFNLLSNWILKVNRKTTFKFRNLFNQIGENETTIRTGVNPTERPNDEFKNYSYHYTSRSLFFSQFEGLHQLSKTKKVFYAVGYSNISRNEPDYRRFRTFRAVGSGDDYTLIDPPSSSLFDAARFYSKLKENTFSGTANYEEKLFNGADTTKDITLKFGTYLETKSRSFNARWISYSYSGDPLKKNDFLKTPVDQIFSPDNINSVAGFKPQEGTNPSDKYTAGNQLVSGYAQLGFPYQKFKFNVGVRGEYFNQTLKSATQNGPVNVVLNNMNVLPSINASYYFDSAMVKSLVRLAYGKTVNRPEFREMAPFVYYDFMYDVNIVGNPDLKSATINNLDLRYEYYPSSSETVSFGTFYKSFKNPIENYVQPIGLSQQFYLKNAAKATNYGVEFELRKAFDRNSQSPFIKKLSTLINASYIISKVDLGKDSTLSQARTRPLQGQSPYIVNAALQYQNDSTNFTFTLTYNIIGKRIVYVGNNIFPTVYEMPRHSIDLTFIKKINSRMSIKFGVSDLLNYNNQLWQDTNGDGKIEYGSNSIDNRLLQYRRGQMFNFGISFKIVDDKK